MDKRTTRKELETLVNKYRALAQVDRLAYSETDVVIQFITRFFEILGYPTSQRDSWAYEQHSSGGRPDITVALSASENLYIEAKRFSVIKELPERRTTTATTIETGNVTTGVAIERSIEEQQAIEYAYRADDNWAILTNFEKLRVYNAKLDVMLFSFETPAAYIDDDGFEKLWDYLTFDAVRRGSLHERSDSLSVPEYDAEYLALINAQRELLAQDILNFPAKNPWVMQNGGVDKKLLRDVVQRLLDRFVIIRFAEDHLVIKHNTLLRMAEFVEDHTGFTFSLLSHVQQFFRNFDDHYNSALFAPHIADDVHLSESTLKNLIETLYKARYRAMPADIIGNTYEQYLGTTLTVEDKTVSTATNIETRKKQGTYYTPQVIVRYMVDSTLGRYLYGTRDGKPDGEPLPGESSKSVADIANLRVLDSACGSGSFLIYAYEVLAGFYRREIERLVEEEKAVLEEKAKQPDYDPFFVGEAIRKEYKARRDYIRDYPRQILERHIYGVDLDPQAAEIAAVNLIMRSMESLKRENKDQPLPLILNQNVKVGNSLIGIRPDDPRMKDYAPQLARLIDLRRQLIETPHGAEHDRIADEINDLTTDLRAELDKNFVDYFDDVGGLFHWGVEFPEVFYDADGYLRDDAGFSVIAGNPPWEIVKPDMREYYAQFDPDIESKLTRTKAEARIDELNSEDPTREQGWQAQKNRIEQQAAYYSASADYTRQGRGDRATHKLFLERMYDLLTRTGRIGYVVPSGIYTDLGTKELREMLLNEGRIDYIYGFSNERFFFKDVHHAFKFALIGAQKGVEGDGFRATFRINPRIAIAPDDLPTFLADIDNLIYMRQKSLARFNPTSLSVMEFMSARDYQVAERVYGDLPYLEDQGDDLWDVRFGTELHMTNDRDRFNQLGNGLPLYEGKMIHQYDSYLREASYWVEEEKGRDKFIYRNEEDTGQMLDYQVPRIAFREISNAVNTRSMIATIVPANTFCNHKLIIAKTDSFDTDLYLLALLNSLTIDYIIRFRVTTQISMYMVKQLPIPRLNPGNPYFDAIVPRAARLTCTTADFADLWREVMGEEWDANKPATDPAERQRLRDELDAIVAHLYGLSRADFAHILSTFPLVFPPDDAGQAKKERLLATYDVLGGWF
ncbi:MAG: N-6 DNA methylase [Chloroflexi bacterium]|nr:N-6 DNA methylase [Chloroflexota bacterium]